MENLITIHENQRIRKFIITTWLLRHLRITNSTNMWLLYRNPSTISLLTSRQQSDNSLELFPVNLSDRLLQFGQERRLWHACCRLEQLKGQRSEFRDQRSNYNPLETKDQMPEMTDQSTTYISRIKIPQNMKIKDQPSPWDGWRVGIRSQFHSPLVRGRSNRRAHEWKLLPERKCYFYFSTNIHNTID